MFIFRVVHAKRCSPSPLKSCATAVPNAIDASANTYVQISSATNMWQLTHLISAPVARLDDERTKPMSKQPPKGTLKELRTYYCHKHDCIPKADWENTKPLWNEPRILSHEDDGNEAKEWNDTTDKVESRIFTRSTNPPPTRLEISCWEARKGFNVPCHQRTQTHCKAMWEQVEPCIHR